MKSVLIILVVLTLCSCGNASAPKVIPGAGGGHLYELMEEDSTEQQADTTAKTK